MESEQTVLGKAADLSGDSGLPLGFGVMLFGAWPDDFVHQCPTFRWTHHVRPAGHCEPDRQRPGIRQ